VAHELPDIFDRVEFRAFWRQRDDADIFGHFQLSGHVPPSLIHQQHAVSAWLDGERYFGKVQRHCLGVAKRQDQASALAKLGADGAKDVDRFRPLIFRC
jgi:hypothetical protein